MKFLSYDKFRISNFLLLILLISVIKINSISIEYSNYKTSQIFEKELCNKEMTNLRNFKIRSSNIYGIIEKSTNNSFSEKLKLILIIYVQIYFILCILSLYKWYEELIKIKKHYIESKFSHFVDLTSVNHELDFEGKYVFASGQCKLIESAQDNVLKFNYLKDYAVVERKVEYFDVTNNKWCQLGYVSKNELGIDLREYSTFRDDFLQFTVNQDIFTFPRFISSKFLGRVEVQSINLNSKQMKSLQINERIQIDSSLNLDTYMSDFDIKDKRFKKIEWEIEDDYIIIYPCDIEIESPKDSKCKLRISLYGYPCKYISIMSQIKNKCFKTIHIPYEYKYEVESDHTSFVNESTNMVITPNFNIDICNILFCLCLSGPATYFHKDSIANNPNSFFATINWFIEEETSKSEFINKKYGNSLLHTFIIRFLFLSTLVLAFYFLPDALFHILKIFGMNRENVQVSKYLYSLLVGKITMVFLFLYTKISFRVKHICNMLIFVSFLLALIFLITKDIILLAEYEI